MHNPIAFEYISRAINMRLFLLLNVGNMLGKIFNSIYDCCIHMHNNNDNLKCTRLICSIERNKVSISLLIY